MTLRIAALILTFAGVVAAGTRDEYGYAWTLELEPGRAAHRLALTEDVYARIHDPALRDLEAFNANGEPIPFGPVPPAQADASAVRTNARVELPWFDLPRTSAAAEAGVTVGIERDAEGRLRRLDATVDPTMANPSTRGDVIIDASRVEGAVEQIELRWQPPAQGGVSAQFEVLGSGDFDAWYTLLPRASVLDLVQGDYRLSRRTIELPGNSARYFKLARLDAGEALVLESVTASVRTHARSDGAALDRQWSQARLETESKQPATYEFRTVGPLPVERLALRLASPNSVALLTVLSRDREDAPWTSHGEITAFRIEASSSTLEHDDLSIPTTRDRMWRVVATPALDRAPTLRVGYRADQFAVLERGLPPYSLAAGSADARRQDYPMAALLGALGAELGREWQLAPARLAAPVSLRGDAALQPTPPARPLRIWALWGVLGIGVVAIITMVLRLLRTSPPQS